MKTLSTLMLVVLFCASASAAGPRDVPQKMTNEVADTTPRMELTVCETGMLDQLEKGEVLYVQLGQSLSLRPDAPIGKREVRGTPIAFAIQLAPAYAASRKGEPLLLAVGDDLTQAYSRVKPMAVTTSGSGTTAAKKPPCQVGKPVREFGVNEAGVAFLLTEGDFTHGVIWDAATGKALYELVRKGG